MKDFPKGFKKRKPKKPRFPIPPPGHSHDSRKDYNRQNNQKAIEQGIEEANEQLPNNTCDGSGSNEVCFECQRLVDECQCDTRE